MWPIIEYCRVADTRPIRVAEPIKVYLLYIVLYFYEG